jgi:hypothetical protein
MSTNRAILLERAREAFAPGKRVCALLGVPA